MRKVILTRNYTGDDGTFGEMVTEGPITFRCVTGELPWRENKHNISCVVACIAHGEWIWSNKHQMNLYHLIDAPGREAIEFHAANWMGDASKGFKCQLQGCIAPGASLGVLDGQKAVIMSAKTLLAFEDALNREPFEITIRWAKGVN